MKNTCAIILAAGTGTRMCTKKPKVLLDVMFKPMLRWVIDSVFNSRIKDVCVVCGYEISMVKDYLKANSIDVKTVYQAERKGTAHAVYVAEEYLKENIGKDVIILYGDVPFIVEHKDATEEVKEIKEVNSGIYWFKVKSLLEVLPQINNYNNQNEFYLPDAVKLLLNNAKKVETYTVADKDIILGANTKLQLNKLNEIAIRKKIISLIQDGVDIPLKDGIIVSDEVIFGDEVRILPGSVILGKTKIGSSCVIGPNVLIENSTIKDGTSISCGTYKNQTI